MGTLTTNFSLYKPAVGETGWGDLRNASYDTIDTQLQLGTVHRASDGSDHTFIDQSVISGAAPVLDGTNFTNVSAAAANVSIVDAGGFLTATDVEAAFQEIIPEIDLNTAKVTNVSTALSTGTVTATTYGITSDGGVDDVVLVEADTTNAGILGSAKWDEIVANTTKSTNVSTTLSTGTVNATTYGITSDGGADDVILVEADTTNAGLLGSAKWDEIVANTAKTSNVSTALSTGTVTTTTYGITSDGGADDVIIAAGTTSAAGVLTTTKFDEIDSSLVSSINFLIDGGGSAVTTGVKGYIEIPFACTINQVTLLADQSTTTTIDIWKDTYANYPPTDADSITAAAVPGIVAGLKDQDATLTGWTTSITAGDILGFNVDANDNATRVTLALKITKT